MEDLRFTDFTQSRNTRRLMRGGKDVAVGARAFDLLDLLVARRGDEGTLALGLPDRPSVIVLSFADLGGDPDVAWLSDGFVENITTKLSRFRDLFAVARNSASSTGTCQETSG